jgi:hypothetical protein
MTGYWSSTTQIADNLLAHCADALRTTIEDSARARTLDTLARSVSTLEAYGPPVSLSTTSMRENWPNNCHREAVAANGRDAWSSLLRDFAPEPLSPTRARPELTFSFRGPGVFACPRGRGALRSQLVKNSVRCSAQYRTRVPIRKNLMRPASRARRRVMRAMPKRFAACFSESKFG